MIKAIKKRRSCRNFKQKPVSQKDTNEILKAAMFSPTGRHIRPWEFIVVKDLKTKEKIVQFSNRPENFKTAPLIIIPILDAQKSDLWLQDGAIVSENMMLEAADLGLASCWVNVLNKEFEGKNVEEEIKKILGVPKKYRIINLIPIGYSAEELPPHDETEFEEKRIHWEKYLK